MERLFSPCTRDRDRSESRSRRINPPAELQEQNLDVSTDDFLTAERAFTYADLYTMLRNDDTVAWLTPHAFVMREQESGMRYWMQLDGSCRFRFDADGKEIDAWASSTEHLSEICIVVLRLLAASVVHSVILNKRS
jgi:hypothetical protein